MAQSTTLSWAMGQTKVGVMAQSPTPSWAMGQTKVG